jgi:mono/diheme cytochrome c family protein
MRRAVLAAVVIVFAAAAWWLTAPVTLAPGALPDHTPDVAAGERVFHAGGCASCHASPVDGQRARGDDKRLLGGGMELSSPYGVFVAPNISPHADGIGGWSMLDFVNAMQRGVAPDGTHYYPSFPYASYAKAPIEDFLDLKAYIDTLPPVAGRSAAHQLGFPWSLRRGIGLWKRRYLDTAPNLAVSADPVVERGRELVEGLGHCGECHTPRDRFGGFIPSRWLAGAPDPEGRGKVPNITPAGKNIRDWSVGDIVYYLQSGFTPDFDTVGGSMVAVQENMSLLPSSDLEAIAAYLKALPPLE